MNLQDLISFWLEPFTYFLYAALLFLQSRRESKAKLKTLFVYYLVGSVLLFKAALYTDTNIDIYSFLSLITIISLGFYFFYTLTEPWKKRVTVGLCVLYLGYYLVRNFILSKPTVFDSLGYVLLSLDVVIMTFMYLHQLLTNVTEESLALNFDFWFVCSQLMYFLGAFVIFLTFNHLTQKVLPDESYFQEHNQNRSILTWLWGVHNVLLFLSSLTTAGSVLWIALLKRSLSS